MSDRPEKFRRNSITVFAREHFPFQTADIPDEDLEEFLKSIRDD